MRLLFIFLFCTITLPVAFCQSKIDSALRKRIISMFNEDQKWRIESDNLQNGKKSLYDEATIDKNMGMADSLNMIQAKIIVDKYGFPGNSLVGTDGSNGFWAIIQHCDDDSVFQQRVLTLLIKEVKRHNAS